MDQFKLQSHPTKEGYFIDDGFGKPITRSNHVFTFNFSQFESTSTYSIYRPYTLNTQEDGKKELVTGDYEEMVTDDLRIEMIPTNQTTYSYIGTKSLIERYLLIIRDLEDDSCKHDFPHLTVFSYHNRESPETVQFTVFLYLEQERVNKIKHDLLKGNISKGTIRFSIGDRGDLVFRSDFTYDKISEEFLQNWGHDVEKYTNLICFYPLKLLPKNYYDYDNNLIKPYDESPIREFSLSFGRIVKDDNINLYSTPDMEKRKVLQDYQQLLMYEVFETDE